MIDLVLDVRQPDCPFVETSEDHAVAFETTEWQFDADRRRLETTVRAEAATPGALTDGLRTLRAHDAVGDCRLVSKTGADAELRTTVGETAAMRTVREYDGYITEPFHTAEGSELWHVGFDDAVAEDALAALERDQEFTVESREQVDDAMIGGMIRNADSAAALLEGCRSLTATERETLQVAVDEGYFDTPRGITLSELADRFDVSKPAVSKNLRRGQRKLLDRAVEVIGDLEAFP